VRVRFDRNFERSKLRLHFSNGETVEAMIIDVADSDDGDGFAYDSVPLRPESSAIWAGFEDLERYEVLES